MNAIPAIRRIAHATGIAAALLISCNAFSAPICVGTSAELNQAFWVASNDEDPTEIRIKIGTYSAPVGGWHYTPSPFDRFEDFTVSGGWQGDCNSQLFDSTLTKLSGTNSRRVLTMTLGQGNVGNTRLSRLSLIHAFSDDESSPDNLGVALQIDAHEHTGSIEIEHVIVRDNLAVYGKHVVFISHAGPLKFRNNLVADNEAGSGNMNVSIETHGDYPYITNNTIANNTVLGSPDAVLGLDFGVVSAGLRYVTNNVVWGNRSGSIQRDMVVDNMVWLHRNNIGAMTGVPAAASSVNYSVDPKFVSASDYRLKAESDLHNEGASQPWGGQSPFDLAGQNRVQNGYVDIGAFETPSSGIFKNSFD